MFRPKLIILLCAGLVGGCASGPALVAGPGLEITQHEALPPPVGVEPGAAVRPYTLGPLDKIRFTVVGHEELGLEEVVVDSAGNLSLPVAGQLHVSGLTPVELGEVARDALRAGHVRDPRVVVNLIEARSQVVTVDGEVKRPGLYPVMGDMTLMRAVASAEGVSEFARLNEVVVFRNVGKQRMAALYSLEAIRTGQYSDPEIYAGDLIVVGDSPGRRLFKDVASLSGIVAAPLVAIVNSSSR